MRVQVVSFAICWIIIARPALPGFGRNASYCRHESYDSGAALLLDAIENSGFSSSVIGSGLLDGVVTAEMPEMSEEEIQEKIAEARSSAGRYLEHLLEVDPENYESVKSRMQIDEEDMRAQIEANRSLVIDYIWAFEGSDPYSIFHQHTTIRKTAPVMTEGEGMIMTGGSTRDGHELYVTRENGPSVIHVTSRYSVTPPNPFGRADGLLVRLVAALSRQAATDQELVISPELREAIVEQDLALVREGGGVRFLGQKEIDGHSCIGIAVGTEFADVLPAVPPTRYWIDVGRGFLCPEIVEEDGHGNPTRKLTASEYFLDSDSGVWFPGVFVDEKFRDNKWIERREYRFTDESVQLNVDIPAAYGVVQLKRGDHVEDEDGSEYRVYHDVMLPVRNGDIRLDGNPGLKLTSASFPRKVVRAGSSWLTWLVLVNIGAILVATVVYLRSRRRRATG